MHASRELMVHNGSVISNSPLMSTRTYLCKLQLALQLSNS